MANYSVPTSGAEPSEKAMQSGDAWRFDANEAFDEDYLFFYANLLTDEVSDTQADLIWRLLELEQGCAVLDLACGHGRIANRLAGKGALVTGLDSTPLFLEHAREEARARGVDVEYVEGDMRDLPWRNRFDAIACVFTAFGYFDDTNNRLVLEAVRAALKPTGRLWIDITHLPWLLANFGTEVVTERDGQWMIDRNRYEPRIGRTIAQRTVIRNGKQRTFEFSVRMFTFTELADWLRQSGFCEVQGYSGSGDELTIDSPRLVVVARASR